jgi:DnaK suppressor protein
MTRENSFLTDDQLHTLENVLLIERNRIERAYDPELCCLDQNELKDPTDEASINTAKSQDIRFRNRELFLKKKIDQALDRLKRGTYGICEDCADEISFERLLARPVAELCICCKEESEHVENNATKHSKSIGKTLLEIGRPTV